MSHCEAASLDWIQHGTFAVNEKKHLEKTQTNFIFFLVPCNSAVQAAWQVSLQGGKFRNGSTWYLL